MISIIIIFFQIIGVFFQTLKIGKKTFSKQSVEGVNFYTLALNAFALLSLILYEYIHKKSKLFTFYSIVGFILFYLSCSFLIKYEKDTNKNCKEKMAITIALIPAALFISLATIGNTKYSNYLGIAMGYIIGLSFIPFLIHVIKKGNAGVSVMFLVFTLITNSLLAYISIGNMPFLIGMILLAMIKYTILIIIYKQVKKEKGDDFIKTPKNMRLIIICSPFITIAAIGLVKTFVTIL